LSDDGLEDDHPESPPVESLAKEIALKIRLITDAIATNDNLVFAFIYE
jgi:hypothetical protein